MKISIFPCCARGVGKSPDSAAKAGKMGVVVVDSVAVKSGKRFGSGIEGVDGIGGVDEGMQLTNGVEPSKGRAARS